MFHTELYQIFNEELTPMLFKPLHKLEREGMLPNSFYKASIIPLYQNWIMTQQGKLCSNFLDEHR
jgi:hypothetical protein